MTERWEKISPERWAATVQTVLTEQPELAAVTVRAMQAGILAANDRLRDRIGDLSLGLVEAMNTRINHVRRNHNIIIRAIRASNVFGSKWSDEALAKEEAAKAK